MPRVRRAFYGASAFFLSALAPEATEPNALIYLVYVGAQLLAAAVFTPSIGLIRSR